MLYSKFKSSDHSGPVSLVTKLVVIMSLCFEMISSKEFKVLMTGFEPFGNPRPQTNPSWEAIRYLDGQTLINGADSFVFDCQRIPVVYSQVEDLIPKLHQRDTYDMIIHVGHGFIDAVRIESQASAFGYTRKDNIDNFPNDYYGPHKYITVNTNPHNYTRYTSVDTQSLTDYLIDQVGYDWVKRSNNAGKYLCEYTLFCSLGELDHLQSTQPELPHRTVLFIHVPSPSFPFTLTKITDTLKAITFAIPQFS